MSCIFGESLCVCAGWEMRGGKPPDSEEAPVLGRWNPADTGEHEAPEVSWPVCQRLSPRLGSQLQPLAASPGFPTPALSRLPLQD